jgi:hypothetical protein
MAEEVGMRKIMLDKLHMLWWVPENSPAEILRGVSPCTRPCGACTES